MIGKKISLKEDLSIIKQVKCFLDNSYIWFASFFLLFFDQAIQIRNKYFVTQS
jgi:hypothetical protein